MEPKRKILLFLIKRKKSFWQLKINTHLCSVEKSMTDRAGSRNKKKINMSIKERKQNLENVLSKVAGVSVEITFARVT